MTQDEKDLRYMELALREAKKAYSAGEVPIGAVVVLNDKIIGRGHNQTEMLHDATAHAEMIALTSAFQEMGSKYLPGAALYVTIEPCLMCSGALYWSKLDRVVFGAPDEKNGYRKPFRSCATPPQIFHPKTKVGGGIMEAECAALMQDFFKHRR